MKKSQEKKEQRGKEKSSTSTIDAKKETRWQWFWRGFKDFISALPG